jgi:ribosomal protein S18
MLSWTRSVLGTHRASALLLHPRVAYFSTHGVLKNSNTTNSSKTPLSFGGAADSGSTRSVLDDINIMDRASQTGTRTEAYSDQSKQNIDQLVGLLNRFNTTEAQSSQESLRLTRRFYPRETYSPRDLDEDTLPLYRGKLRNQPPVDPFEKLGLNPLHEYKNTAILSRYVSAMGRILPRSETGLTRKNQRRLAKAIKRARAMGLMPYTYRPSLPFAFENQYGRF